MIWTLDQIMAVMNLRVDLIVSKEVREDGPPNIMDYLRDKLFSELKEAAQPWAVDLDMLDIRCNTEVYENNYVEKGLKLTVRWYPKTKAIRLCGTIVDGLEFTVKNVWDPFVTDTRISPINDFTNKPYPSDDVASAKTIWKLSGWNEDDRIWTFSPEGP